MDIKPLNVNKLQPAEVGGDVASLFTSVGAYTEMFTPTSQSNFNWPASSNELFPLAASDPHDSSPLETGFSHEDLPSSTYSANIFDVASSESHSSKEHATVIDSKRDLYGLLEGRGDVAVSNTGGLTSTCSTISYGRKTNDPMMSGSDMSSAELLEAERAMKRVSTEHRLPNTLNHDSSVSTTANDYVEYKPNISLPGTSKGRKPSLKAQPITSSTPMKDITNLSVRPEIAQAMKNKLDKLRCELESAEDKRAQRKKIHNSIVSGSSADCSALRHGGAGDAADDEGGSMDSVSVETALLDEFGQPKDENIEVVKPLKQQTDGTKALRRFKCMHCHYESTKLYNVQRHTRKHTNTMIHCSQCGALFYEKYRLDEHIRIVHDGELLVCEYCGKMFASKSGLGAHVRSAHEGCFRFSCEFCDKKFQSPSHYLGHMNRHFNIRPYVCGMCSKGFTQRAQMKAHALICQKEKEFKCELCSDASFKTKKYLLEHYRGKHSDRGYTCACGRKYPWRTSFKRHYQQCWASRMPRVNKDIMNPLNLSLSSNVGGSSSSGIPPLPEPHWEAPPPSETSIAAANAAAACDTSMSSLHRPDEYHTIGYNNASSSSGYSTTAYVGGGTLLLPTGSASTSAAASPAPPLEHEFIKTSQPMMSAMDPTTALYM